MSARLSTVLVLTAGLIAPGLVLPGSGADAACLAGHSRDCVDLTLRPDVTQQLAGLGSNAQTPAVTPHNAPQADPTAPYTGPTIGLNSMVRRAPEIGYHWSIE